VKAAAADSRLRPVGRHLLEGNRVVWGWPGTGFDVRFEGSSIVLDCSGSRAWVDLELDGAEPLVFDLEASGGTIALRDLATRIHDLRIRRRTEGMVGDLVLVDCETDGRFLSSQEAPVLRLEFYGDSITCGYGCLDPVVEHGFSPATESFGLSWAGRLASILGAEVHAQAISGIGVVRNWPGVVGTPLPSRWKRSHQDRETEWDLSSWSPHAVVVNLGTNDYGVLPFLPDREFVGAFRAWLEELRAFRAGVPVVVVDGPLLVDHHPAPGTRTLVRRLLDEVADATGALRFSLSSCDPVDGFAADFHPSVAQHERNAREIAPFLASLAGREPGA
jgi:lysophospholipase L1-like esterase